MPRLFTSASSQALEIAGTALVTTYPFTFCCFWNPTSSAVAMSLVTVGRTVTASHYYAIGVTSAAKPFIAADDGTTESDGIHLTSVTNGQWGHITGVFTSATSRTIYFNGTGPVTDATSRTAASLNTTNIGCLTSNTRTSFANGILANVGIWNVALSADEVKLLSTGLPPTHIRPANRVAYVPINGTSPEANMDGTGFSLVATPTVSTNLPPISKYDNNNQSFIVGNGMWGGEKIK